MGDLLNRLLIRASVILLALHLLGCSHHLPPAVANSYSTHGSTQGQAVRKMISEKWHPESKKALKMPLRLLVVQSKDGKVISARILQSSGHRKAERKLLRAVMNMKFPALPDWYLGETLEMRITVPTATPSHAEKNDPDINRK